MEKIELLEKRIKEIIERNYKQEDIEKFLEQKDFDKFKIIISRKSAFEFVLDIIKEIQENEGGDKNAN